MAIRQPTIKQSWVRSNELIEAPRVAAANVGGDKPNPHNRERLVVLLGSPMPRGDVPDCRSHQALRRPGIVPMEVPPSQLQVLAVTESTLAFQNIAECWQEVALAYLAMFLG
jgi:hypothetical protein